MQGRVKVSFTSEFKKNLKLLATPKLVYHEAFSPPLSVYVCVRCATIGSALVVWQKRKT
jgi:hypothetical protein